MYFQNTKMHHFSVLELEIHCFKKKYKTILNEIDTGWNILFNVNNIISV